MIDHLVRVKHLHDEHQPANNVTDRQLLRTVNNACVLDASRMKPKKIDSRT